MTTTPVNAPANAQDPIALGLSEAGGLLQRGQPAEAESLLRRLAADFPDDGRPLDLLGVALKRQDKLEDAARVQEQALALRPDNAASLNNLGSTYLRLGRLDKAEDLLLRAVALDPGQHLTHNNLGLVHMERDIPAAAEPCFERTVALAPDFVDGWINLGNARMGTGRHGEAEQAYRQAIRLQPDNPWPYNNLGQILRRLGRHEEARETARQVTKLLPDNHRVWINLGNTVREMGLMDEAEQAYRHAIALTPDYPSSYRNLVFINRLPADDPLADNLRAMAERDDRLPPDQRIQLHFALGDLYHDSGAHDRAFFHYRTGNGLKLATTRRPPGPAIEQLHRLVDHLSADFLDGLAGQGLRTRRPVFVVGMPRSGTTLVEQIIHSHPFAHGVGEEDLFHPVLNEMPLPGNLNLGRQRPGATAEMTLGQRGAMYMRDLAALAPPGAERIVNKLPAHFMVLGLIHALLPDAVIIHCQRHPMATGFSCFQQLFQSTHFWTYDLELIGRFHRAYRAVMAHWRAVLPPGRILEVKYEQLVAAPEPQIRRILNHLDLPWDDGCLDFHAAERAVATASLAQVRQPIHDRAVDAWRPYGALLEPMARAIGPEAITAYEAALRTE